MPCWYYDKRDLPRSTASFKDGIEPEVEARYRREGARFIIDTGTKMGLRYDTCATGVVYFHRFYMFHSFKEFHRYVTAACCLFLAGKVEETPKKCKDIIKITKSMLTEQQFAVFGEDPKEEVMTLERILLQTIKFDLQVEHPYAYLLKFSKQVKGDKKKIEKMVQMGWTFINDSMCTTLSLQWEADIIAVALMYLASRLTKFEIADWHGKTLGDKKGKWWDYLVKDTNLDLLEDICHQVLDLYSSSSQAKEDSPPPPPPPPPSQGRDTPNKRSRPTTPQDQAKIMQHAGQPPAKMSKLDSDKGSKSTPHSAGLSHSNLTPAGTPGGGPPSAPAVMPTASSSTPHYNPYMSSQMYTSSFMSQEGSQSIQSILGGGTGTSIATAYNTTYPPAQPQYAQSVGQTSVTSQYQAPGAGYPQAGAQQPSAAAYGQAQAAYQQPQTYAQAAAAPPTGAPTGQSAYSTQYPYPQQGQTQYPTSASQYQSTQPPPPAQRPQAGTTYPTAYPSSQYPSSQYGSQPTQPTTQYSQAYPNTQAAQTYPNMSKPPPQTGMVRGPTPQPQVPGTVTSGGMPLVRITGRRR